MEVKSHKIKSLQALRGIAFLGIYLSHALAPFEWAAISVSAFFILSGFLLTQKHLERAKLPCSLRNNLCYAWSKIKPLYPIHLVMLLASAFLQIFPNEWGNVLTQWKSLILNVFLLHSWFPGKSVNVSFNGVSWFLSAMLFFYFIFPYLIQFIRKVSLCKHIFLFIAFLLIQIISCYVLLSKGIDSNIYGWFMYHFPLFRFVDFYLGCILGKFYFSIVPKEKKSDIHQYSGIEMVAFVITILVHLWTKQDHTSVFLDAVCNDTTLYIIPAGVWTLLFTCRKGIITRVLSNKFFVFLGNISGYAFLIHLMVIQYFDHFCYYLHISPREEHNLLVVALCFVITIGLSYGMFWMRRGKLSKN